MAEPSHSKQDEAEQARNPNSNPPPKPTNSPHFPTRGAFHFWAYLTLFIALLSFLLSYLSPFLAPFNHHSWFLSLPSDLRLHFSHGRLVKIHSFPSNPSFHIFTIDLDPKDSTETVLFLPGLACNSFSFRHVLTFLHSRGIRAIAIDPPGSGFSEKPELYSFAQDVYTQIKEKGIFWAFDQLIETGEIPYEEIVAKKSYSPYGSAEIGRVIQEIVTTMNLSPVHLVIHDSMLASGAANFISYNPSMVRSVTLLDSSMDTVAFPSSILDLPLIGGLILNSPLVFSKLMRLCCSRSIDGSAAEAQRLLLMGKGGRKAIVESGKNMNYSFDLSEWMDLEGVKDLPFQVIWSNNWTDRWIEEGRSVLNAVPKAKFAYHSGGRWSQEDNAEEVSKLIAKFVASLPKTVRPVIDEPQLDYTSSKLDESDGTSFIPRDHHEHGHDHMHDMYGLGQGWAI